MRHHIVCRTGRGAARAQSIKWFRSVSKCSKLPPMSRIRMRATPDATARAILDFIGDRNIVMVGLMGAGKTSVGRRLAARLGLDFVDADSEIETAAGKTIPEIFADHGEDYFRAGESKVIARLLHDGSKVIATGGGAFMNEETRANIAAHGVSVWLRAALPLLVKRVSRRNNRPLLKGDDAVEVLQRLIDLRHPVYASADIVVDSRDEPHDAIVTEVIDALTALAQRS
jgi:shikimate kinase